MLDRLKHGVMFAMAAVLAGAANAAVVTYDFRVPLQDGQFAEYPTRTEAPYVMASTDGSAEISIVARRNGIDSPFIRDSEGAGPQLLQTSTGPRGGFFNGTTEDQVFDNLEIQFGDIVDLLSITYLQREQGSASAYLYFQIDGILGPRNLAGVYNPNFITEPTPLTQEFQNTRLDTLFINPQNSFSIVSLTVNDRSVVATVPEPASASLAALGLVGWLGARRRQKSGSRVQPLARPSRSA